MVVSPAVALVKPFRALRYDEPAAGPLDDLVSPPYDVITPAVRERLLEKSPYNCVRVVRPDDPLEAARTFAGWRERGVLAREERAAVWLLEEEFVGPDGVARTRRGIVARVRVEGYGTGNVLPHEHTFPEPKEARVRLLQAVRTKLSPIFLLHRGPPPVELDREPDLEATLEGVKTRLWRVADAGGIDAALAAVRAPLLIADGHHRYESVLRFHEEAGGEETRYALAALVSREDSGLVVFPTHRLVRGGVPDLDGRFRLSPVDGGAAEALERLGRLPRDRPAFVVLRPDAAVLVEGEAERGSLAGLDTAAADAVARGEVRFTASLAHAEQAVRTGLADAALLVRPPTISEIEAVARAGERLPPKTTYFFPKLTSGLVFAPFDE